MISNGSLRNKGTSTYFADGNLLFYFTLRNLSILAISLHSYVSLHTVTFLFTHIHLPSTQPCTSIHSYVYFHSYILHIVSIFSPHSYLLSHFFTQPHPSLHSYILHTPMCLFFYTSYIHISLLYSYIFKLSTHSDIYIIVCLCISFHLSLSEHSAPFQHTQTHTHRHTHTESVQLSPSLSIPGDSTTEKNFYYTKE